MIVWPGSDANINTFGENGLNAFRASAGAAELDASPETWRVVSYPWTHETPLRVILENAAHHQIVFSQAETGIWRFSQNPMAPHERNAVELDREARGDLGEKPLQPATRI